MTNGLEPVLKGEGKLEEENRLVHHVEIMSFRVSQWLRIHHNELVLWKRKSCKHRKWHDDQGQPTC